MADRLARVGVAEAARSSPLAEVAAAVMFLTRVPVPSGVAARETTGAAAFGAVGAALGVVVAIPVVVVGSTHPAIGAIVAIAVLAAASGALHLDGLADTADALAAPGDRAEQARRDPRTGAAGVAAVAIVLAADVAAIADLAARDASAAVAAIVVAAAVSRASAPAWAVVAGRRLRPSGGLGSWFSGAVGGAGAAASVVTAATVALCAAVITGPRPVAGAVAGIVVGTLLAGWAIAVRRQLDGDGYGLIVELTFAGAVLGAALAA